MSILHKSVMASLAESHAGANEALYKQTQEYHDAECQVLALLFAHPLTKHSLHASKVFNLQLEPLGNACQGSVPCWAIDALAASIPAQCSGSLCVDLVHCLWHGMLVLLKQEGSLAQSPVFYVKCQAYQP